MIDKYKELIIYEIENGWILKVVEPTDPTEANQISCISTHHKDVNSLIEKIQEVCK